MLAISKLQYLRIAPRKVRLVADLVRGKTVEQARTLLQFTVKRGAEPMLKLLNSAIANAKDSEASNLYISQIFVDGGPINKRWRARSRGMAARIQKKTSHVTIELDEINQVEKKVVIKETSVKKEKEIKKEVKVEKPKVLRATEVKTKPKKEVKGLKKIFRRKSI